MIFLLDATDIKHNSSDSLVNIDLNEKYLHNNQSG